MAEDTWDRIKVLIKETSLLDLLGQPPEIVCTEPGCDICDPEYRVDEDGYVTILPRRMRP